MAKFVKGCRINLIYYPSRNLITPPLPPLKLRGGKMVLLLLGAINYLNLCPSPSHLPMLGERVRVRG